VIVQFSISNDIPLPLHLPSPAEHEGVGDRVNVKVGVRVGTWVGVKVAVGLGVIVGVTVSVGLGVTVGPRSCPGPQLEISRPTKIRVSNGFLMVF